MRWGVAILIVFSSCAWSPPKIRIGGDSVMAPKDAGKPASLAKSESGATVALPAGSSLVITKYEAMEATQDSPALPAKEVTEIKPNGPTEYVKKEASVSAQTGTVDTSVKKHEIDVQERRWLLFAAIGCGIGGIVIRSLLPGWPALSNGLLIASPCAFAAWKFADVPSWIWIAIIGVVAAMALGYKRAEWDKDGDGIPDFLEKKP